MGTILTVRKIKSELRELSDPKRKAFLPSFFKTEKGGYGEGDKFLGTPVPAVRKVASKYKEIDMKDIETLLYSPWHEERFLSWVIILNKYEKSENKEYWYNFALKHISQLNNWDLVDIISPRLMGDYLYNKSEKQFILWSDHKSLWVRRIAILSTWPRIKEKEFNITLRLAKKYLNDPEDLIHKATGWMLREVGKKDETQLLNFMDKHHKDMPRIMVSYALEKVSKGKKKKYMINN